jgi:hypothetical protein
MTTKELQTAHQRFIARHKALRTGYHGEIVCNPPMKTHPKSGGNWIAKATRNKGGLHRSLGVPKGKPIPKAALSAAAKKGGTVGKQARLAQTLAKLRG